MPKGLFFHCMARYGTSPQIWVGGRTINLAKPRVALSAARIFDPRNYHPACIGPSGRRAPAKGLLGFLPTGINILMHEYIHVYCARTRNFADKGGLRGQR